MATIGSLIWNLLMVQANCTHNYSTNRTLTYFPSDRSNAITAPTGKSAGDNDPFCSAAAIPFSILVSMNVRTPSIPNTPVAIIPDANQTIEPFSLSAGDAFSAINLFLNLIN